MPSQCRRSVCEPSGDNTVTDKRIDLIYNASSQFTSLKRYEDLTATNLVAETAYTYDSAGRLTDLTHKKSTTTFAGYDWTFDVNGRITKLVSDDGTTDYTYDNSGQLTGATHTYQTNESFTYDATGNRTNTGYTTGTNNRVTSDGSFDYLYDDEGNRTKKTDKTTSDYVEYEWDHRNHLVTVTFRDSSDTKTKEIEYDYDAFDRRIAKHVDSNGNGTIDTTENYVYDGSDIVLVFDGSDNLTDRYLHGPLIDQVFAAEDSSSNNVLWSLTDNQGSVRDVADYNSGTDTTTVSNHIKYDGFGNITSESDSSINFLYSYTGRIYDGDAELYFYRARWYDPVIGRFIGEDPLGFGAGDVNLSRYVGNSSPNFTDPSGKIEEKTGEAGFDNTGVTEMDYEEAWEDWGIMHAEMTYSVIDVMRADAEEREEREKNRKYKIEIIIYLTGGLFNTGHVDTAISDGETTTIYGTGGAGSSSGPTYGNNEDNPDGTWKKNELEEYLRHTLESSGPDRIVIATKEIDKETYEEIKEHFDGEYDSDDDFDGFDDNCAQNCAYVLKKFGLLSNWKGGVNEVNDDEFMLPEGDLLNDWLEGDPTWWKSEPGYWDIPPRMKDPEQKPPYGFFPPGDTASGHWTEDKPRWPFGPIRFPFPPII